MISTVGIVGSGLAGANVATCLRAQGFDGRILLFGDERHHAYDRPSLSKAALLDGLPHPIELMPEGWLESNSIELYGEYPIVAFDCESLALIDAAAESISVDHVVFATGLRPRRLGIPGEDLPGVQALRTWADQLSLRDALSSGARVAIVGGGLIGCEVATSARRMGAKVTIFEAGEEILARVFGNAVGAQCRKNLELLDVDVRLCTSLDAIEGDGRVESVVASDGSSIAADLVLVAIGGTPISEVASAAGIECDRGILVDAQGRTSREGVFAAGDVASWPLRDGTRRSLETYLNAQEQAACVAATILGHGVPAPQVPLGWTEIANRKIQFIGNMTAAGKLVVRRRANEKSHVAFIVGGDGELLAALAVEAPGEFAMARRLVERQLKPSLEQLMNPEVSLREILKSTVNLENAK